MPGLHHTSNFCLLFIVSRSTHHLCESVNCRYFHFRQDFLRFFCVFVSVSFLSSIRVTAHNWKITWRKMLATNRIINHIVAMSHWRTVQRMADAWRNGLDSNKRTKSFYVICVRNRLDIWRWAQQGGVKLKRKIYWIFNLDEMRYCTCISVYL